MNSKRIPSSVSRGVSGMPHSKRNGPIGEVGLDFRHHVTVAGRYALTELIGSGCAVFDANGDGMLDLFFLDAGETSGKGAPDKLYLRTEQGRYRDATEGAGLDRTGYGTGGATLDDLTLMRKHAPPHVQVKAAGGVRDIDTLVKVRELDVSRCGASRTKEMLDDLRQRLGMPAIEIAGGPAQGY